MKSTAVVLWNGFLAFISDTRARARALAGNYIRMRSFDLRLIITTYDVMYTIHIIYTVE